MPRYLCTSDDYPSLIRRGEYLIIKGGRAFNDKNEQLSIDMKYFLEEASKTDFKLIDDLGEASKTDVKLVDDLKDSKSIPVQPDLSVEGIKSKDSVFVVIKTPGHQFPNMDEAKKFAVSQECGEFHICKIVASGNIVKTITFQEV